VLCGGKEGFGMKWIQITDVIKWIAVCVAISISVYVTRDGRYLWFLLIPAFLI
jgi:hypothetical protein